MPSKTTIDEPNIFSRAIGFFGADNIYTVRFHVHGERATTIKVNLSYQYSYDEIKLVWKSQLPALRDWCVEQGVPIDKQIPILIPDQEISLTAGPGQIGSLDHYLTWVLKNKPLGQRLVFIPYNTGGHWITIMIYIGPSNQIDSVLYINSSQTKTTQHHLYSAMKSLLKEDRTSPLFGISSNDFNAVSTRMTATVFAKKVLKSRPNKTNPKGIHPFAVQIRKADLTFDRPIHFRFGYLQTDYVACGVLAIMNAVQCVKAAYLGDRYVFSPIICDPKQTALFRAKHVLAVGIENPFNQKQLKNSVDVQGSRALMRQMRRPQKLNKQGQAVLDGVYQLDEKNRAIMIRALKPLSPEEPTKQHLKRLREAILTIKDRLVGRATPELNQSRMALLSIIKSITQQETLLFDCLATSDMTSFSLPVQLKGEYEQLIVVAQHFPSHAVEDEADLKTKWTI